MVGADHFPSLLQIATGRAERPGSAVLGGLQWCNRHACSQGLKLAACAAEYCCADRCAVLTSVLTSVLKYVLTSVLC